MLDLAAHVPSVADTCGVAGQEKARAQPFFDGGMGQRNGNGANVQFHFSAGFGLFPALFGLNFVREAPRAAARRVRLGLIVPCAPARAARSFHFQSPHRASPTVHRRIRIRCVPTIPKVWRLRGPMRSERLVGPRAECEERPRQSVKWARARVGAEPRMTPQEQQQQFLSRLFLMVGIMTIFLFTLP